MKMATHDVLNEAMSKAGVLIEALPYIQRFNRKIIVVKYGGAAMLDDDLKQKVIEDVVLLKLVGFKPIIVHGGGKEISKWGERAGIETNFVDGLRVTDAQTLEIAEMVLGKVNQDLVSLISKMGIKAVGLSGKDGKMLQAKKKFAPSGADIGFVGEVTKVDPKIIFDMLENDFLPVIFPIGIDSEGHGYNINADDAARAVAEAVGAEKLAFLSDIEGVYLDKDDPNTLISELYAEEARELIDKGLVEGGMLPKIKNCISAIDNGVSRVHILDGRIPHCLLLEIFTDKGVGTAVLHSKEDRYYHE